MKAPPCQFNEIVGKIKVLSMEVRTALSPDELVERLNTFFGKEGLGLDVKEDRPGCITFADGSGYVSTDFFPRGEKTRLHIVTSGWAVQVKRFIDALP